MKKQKVTPHVLPWLKSFLQAEFYNRCGNHHDNKCNFFCIECMKPICDSCDSKSKQHTGHVSLQVYKASRRTGIRNEIMKNYLNLGDIHPYKINSSPIVYIRPKKEEGVHKCSTESKYCSIECKVRAFSNTVYVIFFYFISFLLRINSLQ
ncbi:zf-B_box domain-containing protein [Cephalotus follicularis]|uniref:Zf-B_box domain-containing protein n=1 Tax=Cephalotus follicularis TaxID=3775 RepID=A0A1Q3BK95_CEPFO|nr:zf-B_box domain-containing protein [Cephalotus follicularis]